MAHLAMSPGGAPRAGARLALLPHTICRKRMESRALGPGRARVSAIVLALREGVSESRARFRAPIDAVPGSPSLDDPTTPFIALEPTVLWARDLSY
jgi:hypothetical protein